MTRSLRRHYRRLTRTVIVTVIEITATMVISTVIIVPSFPPEQGFHDSLLRIVVCSGFQEEPDAMFVRKVHTNWWNQREKILRVRISGAFRRQPTAAS